MDRKTPAFIYLLFLSLFSLGCSHLPHAEKPNNPTAIAYTASLDPSLVSRYTPVITIENSHQSYNQIGTVKASINKGKENIYVDPKHASFYVSHREFTSTSGRRYTNLIYRIHFEKVPYSLIPFHLTAGDNGGLIVVITLNTNKEPILITSVHSCGCYLAFTPTSLLSKEAFPKNWNWQTNRVFGENLPSLLTLNKPFNETTRPLIKLRDGTHRVMDISTISHEQAQKQFTLVNGELQPIKALKKLSLPNKTTTSFYHSHGLKKGYVRGANKPLEFLLMSWWSLDLFVGRDKEFGPSDETGNVFYTSLKPWNRKASNMWHFDTFLDFWGWRL